MKILQIVYTEIQLTIHIIHTHITRKNIHEYANKEHSKLKDFIIGIILVYQKYNNVTLPLYISLKLIT
jgi:hypothetical protein